MFVVGVSLYGELFNEIRDLKGDLAAGLRHTAAVLGKKPTYWIMFSFLILGVLSAVYMIFFEKLITPWVLWLCLGLSILFLILPLFKAFKHRNFVQLQESLQKPFEIAAALPFWCKSSSLGH